MQSPRTPHPGLRIACFALLGVLGLFGSPGSAWAGDDDENRDIQLGDIDHACPDVEVHKTFRPADDALTALFEAATKYFDLEEDLYVGRLAFVEALQKEMAKGEDHQGYDLLKDLEFLRRVIYQSRYFQPQWTNKKYRSDQGVENYKSQREWHHLRSDDVSFAYSLPKDYPDKNKEFAKLPRPDPVPLLISTIQKQDYTGQKFPGFSLLERQFLETPSKPILDEWGVLVPIAPAGKYVMTRHGQKVVDNMYLSGQAMRFFESYNVDFDRIVLDGAEEARLMAFNAPFMFAGFVFRTREAFTPEDMKLVKNFASVPVYVIRCDATTDALKKAGHPSVTVGDEAGLHDWLKERKRVIPRKFSWEIAGPQHQFAYWINLEQVNFNAPERRIDVEVVDTPEEPNTIKITAVGVRQLSLYLNDDIVNLSNPVRVVINGHLEKEEKFQRDLDVTFNRDPLKIRESLYFGLIFPVRVMRLEVRPPKVEPKEEPATPTAEVDPKREAEGRKRLDKGKAYIEAGEIDGAVKRLQSVIDEFPETAAAKEAAELLATLNK